MKMDSAQIKKFIYEWAEANAQEFYDASHEIWSFAEPGYQEFNSCETMIKLLEKNGFAVEKGVADVPTSLIGVWGSGKPVIGINAEYDAIPGVSQKGGVTTKNPIIDGAPGHGCGHNLLGIASAKAAVALKEAMTKFNIPGTIKLLVPAAEELCQVKAHMAREGCFDDIDVFLDWHPYCYNRADYDTTSAYYSVKYHFKGKTAHGNSPWFGRSALDAAMLQAHAVEMLREHLEPGVAPGIPTTINYTFTDTGPELPHVVADTATTWHVGRFVTVEQASDTLRRVTQCAQAGALATDTTVDVELITALNEKIPNTVLAEVMHKNFEEIGVPQFTEEEHEAAKAIQREFGVEETGLATDLMPFGGGYSILSDDTEYSWLAPFVMCWVATAPGGIGWHNWGVTSCAGGTIGQKGMDVAAKVIAATGIDILLDPTILERANEEFKKRLNGRTYKCLLPEGQKPDITMNKELMAKYRQAAK